MRTHMLLVLAVIAAVTTAGASVAGNAAKPAPPSLDPLIKTQIAAMEKLAFMDGVWRGPAWTLLATGDRHHLTQTERIGPFLGGAIKVIEGRGYDNDGTVSFNAFAIVSYDVAEQAYTMRSYAQGQVGDFPVTLTDDGYSWEIPAGPMTIRYVATVTDGVWSETGYRVTPDGRSTRFFDMQLKRVGDCTWPAAGIIAPR